MFAQLPLQGATTHAERVCDPLEAITFEAKLLWVLKVAKLRRSEMFLFQNITLLRSVDPLAPVAYFTDAIPSITTRATVGMISRSLA